MVPDDGFLHFYTSAFLFQLSTISYLKKKKKDKPTARIKKKKNWSNFPGLCWILLWQFLKLSFSVLVCYSCLSVSHSVVLKCVCVCVCVASLSLLHILYWEYKQESCWLLLWTVSLGATSRLSILSQVIEWNWSTHSTRRGSWLNLFPGQVISSRMGM